MTQALQATYPACHVDHVNAGVPGFSSPHMLTYYRAYVSKLEPDIVVLLPTDTSVALERVMHFRLPVISWEHGQKTVPQRCE